MDHNSLSSGTVSKPAQMLMQLQHACSAHTSERFKGQKGQSRPLISHLYVFVGAKLLGGKRFVFQVWKMGCFAAYCLLVLGNGWTNCFNFTPSFHALPFHMGWNVNMKHISTNIRHVKHTHTQFAWMHVCEHGGGGRHLFRGCWALCGHC